jgi:hypothetical protein
MLPVNLPPMRVTSVWVKRVRSGAITTMKSTPVAVRIASVCGCKIDFGSGEMTACAVESIFATDSVTAITFWRVDSSASRRASNTAAAAAARIRINNSASCQRNSSAATLDPARFRGFTRASPVNVMN